MALFRISRRQYLLDATRVPAFTKLYEVRLSSFSPCQLRILISFTLDPYRLFGFSNKTSRTRYPNFESSFSTSSSSPSFFLPHAPPRLQLIPFLLVLQSSLGYSSFTINRERSLPPSTVAPRDLRSLRLAVEEDPIAPLREGERTGSTTEEHSWRFCSFHSEGDGSFTGESYPFLSPRSRRRLERLTRRLFFSRSTGSAKA